MTSRQFSRAFSLVLQEGSGGIDLSALHCRFRVQQGDFESPNHAIIRVFNLSEETFNRVAVRGEFSRVVLDAGYEDNHAVVFDGTIKQFVSGRVGATDTFLDILAADGDLGYCWGVVNRTFGAGQTGRDVTEEAAKQMGVKLAASPGASAPLTISPAFARARVGFGMARDLMRNVADTVNASWSIQNGEMILIDREAYLPGDEVTLNSQTGMIGIPEQTDQGIYVRSLLNPRFRIGSTVRLNNRDIKQLIQKDPINSPMPFNQWTGIAFAAPLADGADGLYRVLVIDSSGDTRGVEWWSDLTLLAIDQSVGKCVAP